MHRLYLVRYNTVAIKIIVFDYTLYPALNLAITGSAPIFQTPFSKNASIACCFALLSD